MPISNNQVLHGVSLSGNFVSADIEGNIALQQTGLRPIRSSKHSLLPTLGWRPSVAWRGAADPKALYSVVNPPEGFIASANNQHLTHRIAREVISIEIGDYRVQRIRELIAGAIHANGTLSIEDVKAFQLDSKSLQAHRYLSVLLPLLPISDCEACYDLRAWDGRYNGDSRGAVVFTTLYNEILMATFGRLFGVEAWKHIRTDGAVFYCIMQRLDDILLGSNEASLLALSGGEPREALFRRIARETLSDDSAHPMVRGSRQLSDYQETLHSNLFFQGRLGGIGTLLGIDFGPYPLIGSHATINQGARAVHFGILISAGPIWRFDADMAERGAWSALAGGPSGRWLSQWYASELTAFREGRFKFTAA
jgi:penicillin amidase